MQFEGTDIFRLRAAVEDYYGGMKDYKCSPYFVDNKAGMDVIILPHFDGYLSTWEGLTNENLFHPINLQSPDNDVVWFYTFMIDYWLAKAKKNQVRILALGNSALYLWAKIGGKLSLEEGELALAPTKRVPHAVIEDNNYFYKAEIMGVLSDHLPIRSMVISDWIWPTDPANTNEGGDLVGVTVT